MEIMVRVKVGECDVDSGQIMIIDPCYVLRDDDVIAGHGEDKPTYQELLAAYDHLKKDHNGPFAWELGIVTASFGGDGTFPVYAEMDDDRIQSLTIEFTDVDYDDEED